MKFARFLANGVTYTGVLEGEQLKAIEGCMFAEWSYTNETFARQDVQLLAPLTPNQIIGIGANFVAKKEDVPVELPKIPVFFSKPVASVIGSEEKVQIPAGVDEIKFESELAVVIGKEMKNVAKDDVLDYVFGYTIGNDVTAPQFFHEAGHWFVGKAFDTFTPLGPVIETELDPKDVVIEAYVNGQQKQNSSTELMIVPIREMISYLSNVMTLKPGDVILTGSPVGAEFIGNNDEIVCKIKQIGALRNCLVK